MKTIIAYSKADKKHTMLRVWRLQLRYFMLVFAATNSKNYKEFARDAISFAYGVTNTAGRKPNSAVLRWLYRCGRAIYKDAFLSDANFINAYNKFSGYHGRNTLKRKQKLRWMRRYALRSGMIESIGRDT